MVNKIPNFCLAKDNLSTTTSKWIETIKCRYIPSLKKKTRRLQGTGDRDWWPTDHHIPLAAANAEASKEKRFLITSSSKLTSCAIKTGAIKCNHWCRLFSIVHTDMIDWWSDKWIDREDRAGRCRVSIFTVWPTRPVRPKVNGHGQQDARRHLSRASSPIQSYLSL